LLNVKSLVAVRCLRIGLVGVTHHEVLYVMVGSIQPNYAVTNTLHL
jgi:hypothetical protein